MSVTAANVIRGLDRTPTIAALEAMLNSKDAPKVQINPDGSISVQEQLGTIAKQVAQLEADSQELGEIRATLLLNFGEGDGCRNQYGFVVQQGRTLKMLIEVLEQLVKPTNKPSMSVSNGHVITIHGEPVKAGPGDWVVTDPDGICYYPCRFQ